MDRDQRQRVEFFLLEYGSLSEKRLRVFESMTQNGDTRERQLGAILLETEEREDKIRRSKQKFSHASQGALGALCGIYLVFGFFLGPFVWNLAFGYVPELASWQFFLISLGPIFVIWLLITAFLWLLHRRRCAEINHDYLDRIYFATASTSEKLQVLRERLARMRQEEARGQNQGSEPQ